MPIMARAVYGWVGEHEPGSQVRSRFWLCAPSVKASTAVAAVLVAAALFAVRRPRFGGGGAGMSPSASSSAAVTWAADRPRLPRRGAASAAVAGAAADLPRLRMGAAASPANIFQVSGHDRAHLITLGHHHAGPRRLILPLWIYLKNPSA